ncbi:MAG: MFS transporter [Planctomycetes bacterium]|nr:MFS transporter [Planctomycetota bacterium]
MKKTTANILCNAFGEGLWGIGMNLAPALTVLAFVITRLGGSKLEVGLLSAAAAAGYLFPQIIGSLFLQSGAGRKWFLIKYHFFVMMPPWALMGAVILLFGENRPVAARIALPVLYGLFIMSMGLIIPIWVDWLAGIFRKHLRGSAYGWSTLASALGGTVAAPMAALISARLSYPWNYATLFFIGIGFFSASMVVFMFIRDDDAEPGPPRMSRSEIFTRFRISLGEPNFRRYLLARLLLSAGSGPVVFLAVYYKSSEGGGVAEKTAITLSAIVWIAQALTGLGLGRLGDRLGHRLGAAVGAGSQLAGLAVALLVPGPAGCAIVFACIGMGIASTWVSHQNLLLETCPHDSRTAHITITNLVLAPVTTMIPLATGKAMEIWGAHATFAACLVPTVLGLLWLLLVVREPRTLPMS